MNNQQQDECQKKGVGGCQEGQERIFLKVILKKSVKKRLSYSELGFDSN
jgi:hypothetical protein